MALKGLSEKRNCAKHFFIALDLAEGRLNSFCNNNQGERAWCETQRRLARDTYERAAMSCLPSHQIREYVVPQQGSSLSGDIVLEHRRAEQASDSRCTLISAHENNKFKGNGGDL